MRVATEPPAGAAVLGTLCEWEKATKMVRRTIGILGGMGPLATAEFYRRIVLRTPARYDQEHLHVVIDADPAVPDRTTALLGQGPDPTPHLVAAARRLEAAGVDFLVVPCNTAHAFLPNVQAAIAVPILDMIDEVAAEVARRCPPETPVGLLATAGTIASRLYERGLSRDQLHPVVPDNDRQQLLTAAIGRVKRGLLDERTALQRRTRVAHDSRCRRCHRRLHRTLGPARSERGLLAARRCHGRPGCCDGRDRTRAPTPAAAPRIALCRFSLIVRTSACTLEVVTVRVTGSRVCLACTRRMPPSRSSS